MHQVSPLWGLEMLSSPSISLDLIDSQAFKFKHLCDDDSTAIHELTVGHPTWADWADKWGCMLADFLQ